MNIKAPVVRREETIQNPRCHVRGRRSAPNTAAYEDPRGRQVTEPMSTGGGENGHTPPNPGQGKICATLTLSGAGSKRNMQKKVVKEVLVPEIGGKENKGTKGRGQEKN